MSAAPLGFPRRIAAFGSTLLPVQQDSRRHCARKGPTIKSGRPSVSLHTLTLCEGANVLTNWRTLFGTAARRTLPVSVKGKAAFDRKKYPCFSRVTV